MMPAFDKSYDIVFFVGYHGGIGSLRSSMDHSYSPRFHRIWINYKLVNESLINAAYAGCFDVPVGLVIGDDALQKQLHIKDAMPWVNYVVTKYSLSRFAVKSRPMNILKNETHKAVKDVLGSNITKIPKYKFIPPIKLKIELQTSSMADVVESIPDVKRLDGVTIELTNNNYAEVFDAIEAISTLARSPKW
jgi:D-amino peptidase